jgi:hypothetical protein
VLHAAIHLFFDSDFDSRFRELVDLHVLTTIFADRAPHFWTTLVERAREQGLGRPLYYALETLRTVLETPIPESTRIEIRAFKPQVLIDGWMTRTLGEVLTPVDPALWPPEHRFILWLMYVRSHGCACRHAVVAHLEAQSFSGRGFQTTLSMLIKT